MIYDYQDISTKLYLARMVRKWSENPHNTAIIYSNPTVRELTESDLSLRSTDDVVWTTLYLIGIGLLHYIVSDNCQRMDIALNVHWRPPVWIYEKWSRRNLNAHVDFMMEVEREASGQGIPAMPLVGSLDVIKNRRRVMQMPGQPNRDAEKEVRTIRLRLAEHRRKVAFHRGG